MSNEYSTCHCNSKRLNIILKPFDRDERTRSVENTLALLIKSRFGPGCIYEPVEMISTDWPVETVNYDLMPTGLWALITSGISYDSTQAGAAVSRLRGSLAGVASLLAHRPSPSTLARGSP